jgi:hypothetical protein
MRDDDINAAVVEARRQLDEALAAAVPAATPAAGNVHICGSTVVNAGIVHIGSQTIHQTAPPTKAKTP